MGSIIGSLITWLLGLFFGKKGPKIEDVAASNATNAAQVKNEEAANEALTKAGAAVAAADTRVMHEQQGGPDSVNPSLDGDPDLPYRD